MNDILTAYRTDKGFILLERSIGRFDYTVMDDSFNRISDGYLEQPYISYNEAAQILAKQFNMQIEEEVNSEMVLFNYTDKIREYI